MANIRQLTNLESTALGIVWKHKGCTAYEVMAEFSGSLTAQFKSGAGSVYPLISRLEKDGLIRKKASKRGEQNRSVFSITTAGRKSLAAWVTPPVVHSDLALTPDPIRSRVYFLEILPQKERAVFLEHVLGKLKAEQKKVRESLKEFEQAKNTFGVLAMKGAVQVAKARIAWIAGVLKEVSSMS